MYVIICHNIIVLDINYIISAWDVKNYQNRHKAHMGSRDMSPTTQIIQYSGMRTKKVMIFYSVYVTSLAISAHSVTVEKPFPVIERRVV